MENFPSNSQKQPKIKAAEPKKIERIVEGVVVRRKKPLGKRIKTMFFGGDAKGAWASVFFDILVPQAKDVAVDAGQEAIRRMIFGNVSNHGTRRASSHSGGGNYVNYGNRYSSSNTPRDGRREEPRTVSHRARVKHDFDEIILGTRVEAEEVIDRLFDVIAKYDSATVADLYEMCNIAGSYTDDKWGWVDIRGAGITRVSNGFLLDLPKPEPLE